MRRGLIITFTLAGIAIAIASAIGVTYWRFHQLPHPDQANNNQLLYWLILKDVQQQPADVQVALLDRLIAERASLERLGDGPQQLSESHQQQLAANTQWLQYVWFTSRVDRFHQLAAPQRDSFLAEQIELIHQWSEIADKHSNLFQETPSTPTATATDFFVLVDQWLGQSTGQQHQREVTVVVQGVACWLRTFDLADQSPQTRTQLAERITAELDRGLKLESTLGPLNEAQQRMLNHNSELLLEAWFHQQTEHYFTLATADRSDFVARQVAKVRRWGILQLLAGSTNATDKSAEFAGMFRLNRLVKQWIDRAPAEQQPRMKELFAAVRSYLLSQPVE